MFELLIRLWLSEGVFDVERVVCGGRIFDICQM